MPKFKVKVKVIAEVEYSVEVEASSWAKAEDAAMGMWREQTPEGFQVDKGYITNWEIDSEQTSWECEGCAQSITDAQDTANCGMCDDCAKQHEEAA